MKFNIIKNKKCICFILLFLIVIIFLVAFLIHLFFKKEIFAIDDRVKQVEIEKNKDQGDKYKTIGWLRVQGTNIDAPIITYFDDETSEIDKNNYLWNEIGNEKLFNKVNIMGHNILNLSSTPQSGLKDFSRFDDLMSFIYLDFIKDNKFIQYTIDNQNYIYKIFSVEFKSQDELDLYKKGNYTKKELKNYINDSLDNSLFKFNIDVDENDKIVSLITCTRMFDDDSIEFVVNARLVRNKERLTNYKVKETKKYKKIKDILEGEVKDDEA